MKIPDQPQKTWFRIYSDVLSSPIFKKLGLSIYLLFYLYDKVTIQSTNYSFVLGGKPLSNIDLAYKFKVHPLTMSRYSKLLVKAGFIHTLKVYGGLKIYCVLGYKKWNNDRGYNKKTASLISRVNKEVRENYSKGTINPLNPNFNISDFNDINKSIMKPGNLNDNSVSSFNSAVATNIERTEERTENNKKNKEHIERGNDLISNHDCKSELVDIIDVYQYYMQSIGSMRQNPGKSDIELIKNILAYESISVLKKAIDKYLRMVNKNPKWTCFPPSKFFSRDFYIRFLDTGDEITYKPRNPSIDPANFANENKEKT